MYLLYGRNELNETAWFWDFTVVNRRRMAAPRTSAMRREAMNRLSIAMISIMVVSCVASVVSQRQNTAPAEKEALLALRRGFRDQGLRLSAWEQSTDPCSDRWTGIFCVEEDEPKDADPNFHHVTEVRLMNLNLGGQLGPEVGNLTALKYFDVFGNSITGGIPREFGKLSNLFSLTLSRNNITGAMPEELGNLINLNRLQLDENQISGPLRSSFSKMVKLQHIHLNNNSIDGSIPKEIGQLPIVVHILLDSNRISGLLPVEIANISVLVILQLDNNNFEGGIPPEYGNFTKLTKLSCRNCGLSGSLPDLSGLSELAVLDLSLNSFDGEIPSLTTNNITSIDLADNKLTGEIPEQLQFADKLQSLRVANNKLEGAIPEFTTVSTDSSTRLLDFQNNSFSYVSLPMVSIAVDKPNIHLRLSGNMEICEGLDAVLEVSYMCNPVPDDTISQSYSEGKPRGKPLLVAYRLKSPSFVFFTSEYYVSFIYYIADGLFIDRIQVKVQSWEWQPGPRLEIMILIFPSHGGFNQSEIDRIGALLAHWNVKKSTLYGPYELLGFTQLEEDEGLSAGGIAGIVVASIAVVVFMVLGVFLLRTLQRRWRMSPAEKRRQRMLSRTPAQSMLKIKGVQVYTYKEMEKATDGFSTDNQVGEGGYGKVYRGRLEDGAIVAIKKAGEAALQRNVEFYNEIELLSRCHHRNLVCLIGYCNDEDEQMLVYEFMEGGTLDDNLRSTDSKMDFEQRLRIALGSARGILYLHTEADPPIYHRDIKATNILLNERREAKVADFGLSRLAPLPDLEGVVMTHVSTVVKGTPGYLDPEYFLTRQLTDKSDVYSFGVVLLELLTGMQPISMGKNIVREVRQAYDQGNLLMVVDERLGSYPLDTVEQLAKLALRCVASETAVRPPMQEVCHMLESLMKTLTGQKEVSTSSIPSLDVSSRDFCKSGEFPFQAMDSGLLQTSQHQKATSNSRKFSTTFSLTMPHSKDVSPR